MLDSELASAVFFSASAACLSGRQIERQLQSRIDRLLAENNEDNQSIFSKTFNEILEKNYPDAKWVIEDYSEMDERLAFTIKFQDDTDIIIN